VTGTIGAAMPRPLEEVFHDGRSRRHDTAARSSRTEPYEDHPRPRVRHDHRVVRLLHLRQPGGVLRVGLFPKENPTAALLSTLATFATGFVVRPFGAIVFGRIGDLIGRKYAFVITLTTMGLATTLTGLVPTYAQIGILAPTLLVLLRLLQGLALGGEYGGAATYIAEHSPDGRRGYYTSWIQTTATVGLFVSLLVVLIVRLSLGEEAFRAWAGGSRSSFPRCCLRSRCTSAPGSLKPRCLRH
jgi:MFS family permease